MTADEQEFLNTAHLDYDGDLSSGDEETPQTGEPVAEGHGEGEADFTHNTAAVDGQSVTSSEAATCDTNPYPVEVQWTETQTVDGDTDSGRRHRQWTETQAAKFAVGDTTWYYWAPNLGGAAGTAALQGRWREGVVAGLVQEVGDFLLYEIDDDSGTSQGIFASAHVKLRSVPNIRLRQPFTRAPEDWCNVATPMAGRQKRGCY